MLQLVFGYNEIISVFFNIYYKNALEMRKHFNDFLSVDLRQDKRK